MINGVNINEQKKCAIVSEFWIIKTIMGIGNPDALSKLTGTHWLKS